jgi:hypothetical protein
MHKTLVMMTFSAALLGGCGSTVSVWPFGTSGPAESSREPANATEYRCDGGKRFFVRPMEDGAAWLIAPDRQIRLARTGGPDSNRFSAGRVTLEIEGQTARLADPPTEFTGCRVPSAEKPADAAEKK